MLRLSKEMFLWRLFLLIFPNLEFNKSLPILNMNLIFGSPKRCFFAPENKDDKSLCGNRAVEAKKK